MKNLIYSAAIAVLVISCDTKSGNEDIAQQKQKAIAFDGIDTSIAPGDNFYNHVNKTWYDNAVIADDQVGVGAYRFLNIPQQELLKNILEEVSTQTHPKGSVEQLVGDFYASGMDTLSIDKRGIEPMKPILNRIESINNVSEMMGFVSKQIMSGDYSVIAPYISPDQKNSTVNILHVGQTGLGLPDRDYYFNEDGSSKAIQEAYKKYIATIFELVGEDNAFAKAETVYSIEQQLASAHKTRIERRVIKDNYNKF